MTLNKLDTLITTLRREKENGHLKAFDLSDWGRLNVILESKTDKQAGFINFLIINNKYSQLNNVLTEWKL